MAVQTVSPGRRPAAERFAKAFSQTAEEGGRLYGEKLQQMDQERSRMHAMEQENEAAKREGFDLEGISDPKTRQELFVENIQSKNKSKEKELDKISQYELTLIQEEKDNRKAQRDHEYRVLEQDLKYQRDKADLLDNISRENREKAAPFIGALDTVNEMRRLGKTGNLGIGSEITGALSGKGLADRAKYTQLGKSLIQFASSIPIRNQQEFITLAHDLYHPTISDSSRKGILDAMEDIIKRSLSQYQERSSNENTNENGQGKTVSLKGKDGITYDIPEDLKDEFLAEMGE